MSDVTRIVRRLVEFAGSPVKREIAVRAIINAIEDADRRGCERGVREERGRAAEICRERARKAAGSGQRCDADGLFDEARICYSESEMARRCADMIESGEGA